MDSVIQKARSLIPIDDRRRKHRVEELASYRDDLFKSTPSDQVRVVIFGQGRTGSSVLESLLASTGHFRTNRELLNTSKGEVFFPLRYTRGMAKGQADDNFLFHLKIYHLTRDRRRPVDPAKYLKSLDEDGWKIVYLRRRKTVRHQLSNAVLEHRGGAHKFDDAVELHRVVIDCEAFVEKVAERLRFAEAERDALNDLEYCEVIYEDDLEDAGMHQSTVDRVLDFASLEHRPATTKHRKVNTQDVADLVINYDEFVECLEKNDLQALL